MFSWFELPGMSWFIHLSKQHFPMCPRALYHFRTLILSYSHFGCCSVLKSCPTLCDTMEYWAPGFPLSFTISQSLLKLLSIESLIHPTISTSVAHISCPQSFPALGSFPIRWLFASGGQRIGGSASVLPMNIQGSCPLGLTGLISLQPKRLSRVFSSTTVQKHQLKRKASIIWLLAFFMVQLSYPYMTTGKTTAFCQQSDVSAFYLFIIIIFLSLLFNTLSRFISAFLPRSKHLLISWLQSTSTVILEPKKICQFPLFPLLFDMSFLGSSAGKESACNAWYLSLIPGSGSSPGEGIGYPLQYSWASLVAQLVKNPPAMQEIWVWSLGWEDPLERGKVTHSSILAWESHEYGSLAGYSPWGHKEGHDWATFTHFTHLPWSDGTGCHYHFWMLNCRPDFSLSFTFI